ncbi:hypothetical protein [Prochlorococcus marinus]|uniref:hypothetical protein n=1 Tax=Prochlorococcus marinus TaxID=1219 RepID=UPI0007B352D8|nr:hypothetical protein [Prochlorococcus marinus]KZR77205.1 hypothetical protein PMIT1320_00493 [Prochlorococcus marinus str. MIT 1320]
MQLSCWGMGRQAYGLALAGAMLLLTTPSMAFKGIRQIPYPQAEQVTRTAAEAVIVRSGSESCLRGKLTNALLDLTMSCSATGRSSSLCKLAGQVASQEGDFSLAQMTTTAETLLDLLDTDSVEP